MRRPAETALLVALAVLAGVALAAAGAGAERLLAPAAVGVALAGLARPDWTAARRVLAVLLPAAVVALALHFFRDDFGYRYVWSYSAADLPWRFKLAGLWSGDPGIMLLLAALAAAMLSSLAAAGRWALRGGFAFVAFFAAAAIVFDPFAAQAPAAEGMGINAHLTTIWALLHPPAVLFAFLIVLMPAAAAAEALLTGRRADWAVLADRWLRPAWVVLTLGLALGIAWSYEDYTFGQFWHWDPVQTATFALWSVLTALLHLQRGYAKHDRYARLHPVLGLAAAALVLLTMAATRDTTLASSHRYVGATAAPLLLAAAVVPLAAMVAGLARRGGGVGLPRLPLSPVQLAAWLFVAAAAIALGQLAHAYGAELMRLDKPEELRPYFETLARWIDGEELQRLRRAFAQWEVNPYWVNAWMAPLAAALALVGGHFFLPLASRRRRWAVTGAVVIVGIPAVLWLGPLAAAYGGGGMTSRNTVAMLPLLDLLTLAAVFFLGALGAWTVARLRQPGADRLRVAGIGLLHGGVAVAVMAVVVATVFDGYAQRLLTTAEAAAPVRFPGGYEVNVTAHPPAPSERGSPRVYRALADVEWTLRGNGAVLERARGYSVYRDEAAVMAAAERGPMRAICEALDYRYSRYAATPSRMIQPFIHRGLWQDVQVWVPLGTKGERLPIVLKVFPAVSAVWIGLAATVAGGALTWLAGLSRKRRKAPQ